LSYSILIVDDSELIRNLLRSCIEANTEWQVCGEAENGQLAVDKVEELHPDIVILDYQMPVMNGIEAARQITRLAPNTAMVMFTMHDSDRLTIEARQAQAQGLVLKSQAARDLIRAIERLLAGGTFFASEAAPAFR